MVAKQVHPLKGALYIVAQCLGSIIASGVLMEVMGLDASTMGGYNLLTGPDDRKVARGFILELILTKLLVLTVFATIDPTREATGLGPLAIGLAVAVAHFIAVPITGCGINPARSLGPAVFTDNSDAQADLWVFIVAPIIGGVMGGVLYPFWFAKENFIGGLEGKFKTKVEDVPDAEKNTVS
jgi:aquaporin Z